MSDTPPSIETFTREELLAIVKRDRWVKAQQAQRVSGLMSENLELLAIIQELQGTLAELRESEAMLFAANVGQAPESEQQEPAPEEATAN